MRHFVIAFAFVSAALSGCSMTHERVGVAYEEDFFGSPVIPMGDAGPFLGDGGTVVVVPDAGPVTPDSGPIVADAGSDAYVPPMDDAGSDAGMPPEPDAGSDAGSDAGPPPGPCDAVDVPADGSGHIVIRVEGGGDMTIVPGSDFIAFSVTIENHMTGPVESGYTLHNATLSADCTVAAPGWSYRNDCDALSGSRIEFCGAGACGVSCYAHGPTFPSGSSTTFTMYGGGGGAPGTFRVDVNSFSFLDAAGMVVPAALIDGLEMTPALATVTVPDLLIQPDNMRRSAILVAGGAVWQQVASFMVDPDETLASVDVVLDGDAADIEMVAIATDGRVLGTGIFPAGVGSLTSVELTEPLVTPPGERRRMDVWVKIPNVMSNLATGGADIGVCNSGDSFSVGVRGVDRYVGASRFHTDLPTMMGNEFVIRMSRPTLTRQTLSTTNIANGTDQDLYKFQVSADSAGSIVLRRIGMNMYISSTAGRVCNLRLRRGSTELPASDYSIGGPMFWGTERCWTPGRLPIVITFNGEQTVTGSGNVYTVVGTPEGFVSGDLIRTSFSTSDDHVYTGYLFTTWTSTSTDLALDLSPYGAPYSTREIRSAAFIWSDLSEVPHSPELGTAGGSRDWTNGYLLEDLTQPQTLIR